MSTISQRSFAGGEIAPALYARVDLTKYATGLKTLRNFHVMRHGGAQNRAGTGYVDEVKDSTKAVRLFPFIFNSEQTYVLEFGDLYMRVIKNGAHIVEASQALSAITNANPCVVTYVGADNYANGDEVYVSGIVGAIGSYLNGRNFKVAGVNVGANTFELNYMDGSAVNSTGFGAYTSGGTVEEVYTIATPYLEVDLSELQIVQSADVMTIVHPNYAPRELARLADANWTLTAITFLPDIDQPDGGFMTSVAAGAETYRYRVTAIKDETYEESLPGLEATKVITGATQANPVVVTSVAHGYANGDEVYITGVGGMTEINDIKYFIANVAANTFELAGIDGTGYTAYTAGGTVARTFIKAISAAVPTTANPHIVNWVAVSGALEYNIYKEKNGVYGYLGTARTTDFDDVGLDPDVTDTPPNDRIIFDAIGDYPSCVTYYQQRLGFAASNNEVEKVWFSRSGQFKNFTTSSPIQDDDAVTFEMAGRQVNKVRHMIDIGQLIVFTTGGEWSVGGDPSGVIGPGEINPKQYSYNGASTIPPIVIGSNALYVQGRGSIVRDISFDYQVDGYRGNDLTIFSAHLFDDYQIVDWAYQQTPHSILWAVRDDGVLIGLTYVREQDMVAWHRHDTDGLIENVCVVPEGSEDVLYVVVKRTIDGTDKRYIERLNSRNLNLIEDAKFVDSSLSYDGRNTGATTMTLSGSGWTYTDTLTLTASASFFSASDIGNQIHLVGADGTIIRCSITAYTSATVVSIMPHATVPVAMQAVAILTWSRAVDFVSGLWHIEGKDVSIFADGFVVANPNNDAYDVVTVTNGAISLDKPYAVINVGLPYTSDIETLNVDTASGETIVDKKQLVSKVTLFVEDSRGVWVGGKPPTDEAVDFLEGLTEVKVRNDEGYDEPVALRTGTIDVNIKSEWNSNGRIFIRQTDPLPLAVLAVAPAGLFPFR
jgi:hypothetical protein